MEEAKMDGYMGYHASKTFAERTAWEMWQEARDNGDIAWDLVTFCPPMVYWPPIQEVDVKKGVEGSNTSIKRMITSIQGKDPNFAPKVATPGLPAWVHVRDIAEAHLRSLSLEKGVGERSLLCGGVDYFEDGLVGLRQDGEGGWERKVRGVIGASILALIGVTRSRCWSWSFIRFRPRWRIRGRRWKGRVYCGSRVMKR
jgi:hypothetical protein